MFVVPELKAGETFEHIYREANGLRWNRSLCALHAYEPSRWEHRELLCHMASTLRTACDEELHFTENTVWQSVPEELQVKLRLALA
jgi:hypothetical protein